MLLLVSFLLILHCAIAYQCYLSTHKKGYPTFVFTLLSLIPYFNLVVWVYLLFLPNLNEQTQMHQSSN
ncbi:hypothetical protein [Pseudoalteromonas phenolica]|uniref:Uncharacterized protein n=1 Tax=Pseudoalteromonas phenolica TaxID=161398 RepID=A0A0S2JXY4_9GAMM|nr:hypothetical protein [Pseudoalteromonas phenolica]ALO41015.1 hypothetical protein PP2015_493 [Pseudoalteromonas phenolica]MBE0354463.1 hypothetical protein [Pseudoalteromonas phenolica O-BC30]RXF03062.1 hypothetical protein D9981_06175 [Pseudoalteromonas phenolica O-BC30]TMO55148.1 hypothetical protein CWC21_12155 [Pseudoalteromonas phenolica]